MLSKTLIFLMVVALLASTFTSSYGYPAQSMDDDDDSLDDMFDDYEDADADDDSFDLDLDPADLVLMDMFADLFDDDNSS